MALICWSAIVDLPRNRLLALVSWPSLEPEMNPKVCIYLCI